MKKVFYGLHGEWIIFLILKKKKIFYKKAKSKDDRENLVLYRGNNVFVVMNLYPYNNGHLMIVPLKNMMI